MQKQNKPQLTRPTTNGISFPISKPENHKIYPTSQNKPKDKPIRGGLKIMKQQIQKQEQKKINTIDIINQLVMIQIQDDFQQMWEKFIKIVGHYFKFKMPFPESVCQIGDELMKNGSFFVHWLKIINKNQFICMPMIIKHVKQKYLPTITISKQYLQLYLKQFQLKQQLKTPTNTQKINEPLKRSILKNSQKKVQFGKDQIIYPTLLSYISPTLQQQYQQLPTKLSIQSKIRQKHGYLLDFFEINDIYLLEEVDIVGVIKQYGDMYAIVQVREKATGNELTCIAIASKQSASHKIEVLKQIERQFQNLGYLQLDGRSTSQIWVDCLPSQTK